MGFSDMMAQAQAKQELNARLAPSGVVDKNTQGAWILWLVTGWLGGHRFYLRKHGWLMLIWFFGGIAGLPSIIEDTDLAMTIFTVVLLAWWGIDAFFIPRWLHEFQSAYARAARKLEAEDMAEALTLPFMKAAQKHDGTLTVTQGVLATGLTFTEVEQCLMEMSKSGYVGIENDDDGNLLFVFGDLPELDPDEEAQNALLEARALALDEAADALALEAELLDDAEKRERRRDRGSSVLRGAVAGLTALGLHSILDDDE